MASYDKAEIGRVASEYGFVRDTFEKVLRIVKILRYFNEQEFLKEHLVLKGGTAINLTIFNLPRLSVDIDLDYMPNENKDDMLKSRERITEIIKTHMESEEYTLSSASRFSFSLDAFYYQYQNCGGNQDMIKIEINYSLRAHVFSPVLRSVLPEAFNDGEKILTLDPIEIFAAKGNALISRAAARDLYDWGNFISSDLAADKRKRDLFRKCFIFYTTVSAETINLSFDTAAIETLTFNKIRRDLFPVISNQDKFLLEERKKAAKEYITELMQLTKNEKKYMECFKEKDYRPELLFEDAKILDNIKAHPMALWKCRKE